MSRTRGLLHCNQSWIFNVSKLRQNLYWSNEKRFKLNVVNTIKYNITIESRYIFNTWKIKIFHPCYIVKNKAFLPRHFVSFFQHILYKFVDAGTFFLLSKISTLIDYCRGHDVLSFPKLLILGFFLFWPYFNSSRYTQTPTHASTQPSGSRNVF